MESFHFGNFLSLILTVYTAYKLARRRSQHMQEPGKYTNAAPSYSQCMVAVTTRSTNCGNVASTVEASRTSTLTIEVDLAAPVSRMKRLIDSKWVIPVRDQLIWFDGGGDGGVLLRDHQKLGAYGIAHGTQLRLELRARTPPHL